MLERRESLGKPDGRGKGWVSKERWILRLKREKKWHLKALRQVGLEQKAMEGSDVSS